MIYHMKCAMCGKEFVSASKTALYCSHPCKQKAAYQRAKEAEARLKQMRDARIEMMRQALKAKSRKCRGCVWKSWQDHKKCVMPTCMLKALAKKEEEEAENDA